MVYVHSVGIVSLPGLDLHVRIVCVSEMSAGCRSYPIRVSRISVLAEIQVEYF